MNLSKGDRVELFGRISEYARNCRLQAIVKRVDGDNNITIQCAGEIDSIKLKPTFAGGYTDGEDIFVTVKRVEE